MARTLPRPEIEARLDNFLRRAGEAAINKVRDDIRALPPRLDMEEEAHTLDGVIGTLLGTRDAAMRSPQGRARRAGHPYDPDRVELFTLLHGALREHGPTTTPAPPRDVQALSTLSFFEAYFSNFIEGTEFEVEEAADIVFRGVIPPGRPADAHDVIGTWRIVSDPAEMRRTPTTPADLTGMLHHRHAAIMEQRRDKGPGQFKAAGNRAGSTVFVTPDLVAGTLEKGFEMYRGLEIRSSAPSS